MYLPQEETTRCSVEHVRRPQVTRALAPRALTLFLYTLGAVAAVSGDQSCLVHVSVTSGIVNTVGWCAGARV